MSALCKARTRPAGLAVVIRSTGFLLGRFCHNHVFCRSQ